MKGVGLRTINYLAISYSVVDILFWQIPDKSSAK